MKYSIGIAATIGLAMMTSTVGADVIVDYTLDLGGNNNQPLNGLTARATFSVDGDRFAVLLANPSTGVPNGFEVSDSLLVSLAMNLPEGIEFLNGDAAVIGPDSIGLGRWDDRGPGDSVGEQWLWTNDFGGDFLSRFAQVISTSNGQGGGETMRFDGMHGTVGGPFGGIAADPPIISIPSNQEAVSDDIMFELRLSAPISEEQLRIVAGSSVVEFGSDQRYLGVPEPAGLVLMGLGGLFILRRRTR